MTFQSKNGIYKDEKQLIMACEVEGKLITSSTLDFPKIRIPAKASASMTAI